MYINKYLLYTCRYTFGVLKSPGKNFENLLQLKRLVYILKEIRVENGYFHREIMISAAEMLGGSGACSPRKF